MRCLGQFGNKFCLKKRPRLIKALNNRFYVKFMQLEIGLHKLGLYARVLLEAISGAPIKILLIVVNLNKATHILGVQLNS